MVEFVSPYTVRSWGDTFNWQPEHRVRMVVAGTALGADGRRRGAAPIIEPALLATQRRGDPIPITLDHEPAFTVGRVAAVELDRAGDLVVGGEVTLSPRDALDVMAGRCSWSVEVLTGSRPDRSVGAARAVECRLLSVSIVTAPSARAARPLAWSAAPLRSWELARAGGVPPLHAECPGGASWAGPATDPDRLKGIFHRAAQRLSACRADATAATSPEHYRDEVSPDWHEASHWRLVLDRRTSSAAPPTPGRDSATAPPTSPTSASPTWGGWTAVTTDRSSGPFLKDHPEIRVAGAMGRVTRVS